MKLWGNVECYRCRPYWWHPWVVKWWLPHDIVSRSLCNGHQIILRCIIIIIIIVIMEDIVVVVVGVMD